LQALAASVSAGFFPKTANVLVFNGWGVHPNVKVFDWRREECWRIIIKCSVR
jgi:hypothetical protein